MSSICKNTSPELIELSFISMGLLVESWLFCRNNFPSLIGFWYMHRDSLKVCTKNILCWLIESPTRLAFQEVLK